MDENRTQELLLQVLQDIAVIKAKLDNIEEIKLDAKSMGIRLDSIEAQNREHDKTIKSLEHRSNEMEKFTRQSLLETKKQQNSVMLSIGVAIFSAVLSLAFSFIN